MTPLIDAAKYDAVESINILIKNKTTNLNLFNKYQNTALHVAATNNSINAVRVLLENKADIMKANYVKIKYLSYLIYLYRRIKLVWIWLKTENFKIVMTFWRFTTRRKSYGGIEIA
jgi:ankyrin repeat protein